MASASANTSAATELLGLMEAIADH